MKRKIHAYFQREFLKLILIILTITLSGCYRINSKQCVFNGQIYSNRGFVFTGQWYEHYQRALAYMEGHCYDAALDDLNIALQYKPIDQWMIHTYGMHYIDYFPNREKGIIFHFLNKFDDSIQNLKKSIIDQPTDKAFYYLDQSRKQKLILQNHQTKPVINVLLKNGQWLNKWYITNKYPITISGIAEDSNYVSSIKVNDQNIFIPNSQTTIQFQKDLFLNHGYNVVNIETVNLLNETSQKSLNIFVDQKGPSISIHKYIPGSKLIGFVNDESKVISLIAESGNQKQPIEFNDKGIFSLDNETFFFSDLHLISTDLLNNVSRLTIRFKQKYHSLTPCMIADSSIVMSDTLPYYKQTTNPIRIDLKGVSNNDIVYSQSVEINCQVTSQTMLNKILIQISAKDKIYLNKKEVIDISKNQCNITSFVYKMILSEGENTFTITAIDINGKRSEKSILIHRKTSEVFQIVNRYRLKMFRFESPEWTRRKNTPHFSKSALFFQCTLFEETNHYKRFLMTLQKNLMIDLNTEKSGYPVINVNSNSEFDASLFGNVYDNFFGMEIIGRIVDNWSEIIAVKNINTIDVFSFTKSEKTIKKMANRLSEKFNKAFPVYVGNVISVDDEKIFIDFHTKYDCVKFSTVQNIKNQLPFGWPVILYRNKNAKNKLTPENSIENESIILAHALISGYLDKNRYLCKISKHLFEQQIKKGDMVITR